MNKSESTIYFLLRLKRKKIISSLQKNFSMTFYLFQFAYNFIASFSTFSTTVAIKTQSSLSGI